MAIGVLILFFLFPGSIPSCLGDITRMNNFQLTNTSLTGSLPLRINEWSALRVFIVSDNLLLTGEIPVSLGGARTTRICISGECFKQFSHVLSELTVLFR